MSDSPCLLPGCPFCGYSFQDDEMKFCGMCLKPRGVMPTPTGGGSQSTSSAAGHSQSISSAAGGSQSISSAPALFPGSLESSNSPLMTELSRQFAPYQRQVPTTAQIFNPAASAVVSRGGEGGTGRNRRVPTAVVPVMHSGGRRGRLPQSGVMSKRVRILRAFNSVNLLTRYG